MGSLAASGIILKDVTLSETLLSISILLFATISANQGYFYTVKRCREWSKAEPTLLVHEGTFLETAMREERVTKNEVTAAMRESGIYEVADVQWVILEADASFSVIQKQAHISTGERFSARGGKGVPSD